MPEENAKQHYGDIINLPHHQSATRPHMSMRARAAQFAPFAALSGYDAIIAEAVRLTDERIELDEYEIAALDARLRMLRKEICRHPVISVTYFCPDEKKSGGVYLTKTGAVKKVDEFEKKLIFEDETVVPIREIINIEGKITCGEPNAE